MRQLLLILSLFLLPLPVIAQDTYEIEKPFRARSLSGVVVDNIGGEIPGVLVERLSTDRKSVQGKTVTDTKGSFSFPGRIKGKYLLRLTKDGWSPIYITVIIERKARADLKVAMIIAR